MNIVARNRKARHDYHIEETYEAGIVLRGQEVKSVREGGMSIKQGYVSIEGGEAYLFNCHISEYSHSDSRPYDPERPRKLLLHKREIEKLFGLTTRKGYTIVPTKAYFNSDGKLKLQIAVGKGKKKADKREAEKRRIEKREAERAIKDRDY